MNEPVDLHVLAALRGDREAPAPRDAQSRVASRLGIADPISNPPAPRGPAASTAAASPKVAMLALAFIVGGAMGALLRAPLAKSSAPTIVYVDRPIPSPSTPPVSTPTIPSSSSVSPEIHKDVPRMVDSRPPADLPRVALAPSPSHDGLSQLDAERALLDTARSALVSGDSDAALSELDRHANAYPHPLLSEEHDALLIQALVRTGRYDQARARADAFRRKSPSSLLLPAVESAIASIP